MRVALNGFHSWLKRIVTVEIAPSVLRLGLATTAVPERLAIWDEPRAGVLKDRQDQTTYDRSFPLLHGPFGLDQSFVATHERMDVPVAHLLRYARGKDRSISATAIHNNFLVRIRKLFFQVALKNSFAQVHRLLGMVPIPFVILPNIEQHSFWILTQAFAGLFHREFVHVRSPLAYQFQKAG